MQVQVQVGAVDATGKRYDSPGTWSPVQVPVREDSIPYLQYAFWVLVVHRPPRQPWSTRAAAGVAGWLLPLTNPLMALGCPFRSVFTFVRPVPILHSTTTTSTGAYPTTCSPNAVWRRKGCCTLCDRALGAFTVARPQLPSNMG